MITGPELRDARISAGYSSQADLGRALGVSTRTITYWESSSVSPRAEVRVRALLWPPLPLASYSSEELLAEVGRRLADAEGASSRVRRVLPG